MRQLGRCGRARRKRGGNKNVSQESLPKYIHLQKWLKRWASHKHWNSPAKLLKPCDFKDTGRGLQAVRTVHPGDTIVSIPLPFLIMSSTVLSSDVGSIILKNQYTFSPQKLLTMFLVIENSLGEASSWAQYINTLPQVYSTPLYFSPMEVTLLEPRLQEKAKGLRERFYRACIAIRNFVKHHMQVWEDCFTEERLRWGWSTVDTRSVYLQTDPHPCLDLDPEESNVALAPFLDLLNHTDTSKMVAGVNTSTDCYEIVTFDHYNKWDQVFISYGAHDNAKLMVNYGFVLPQNNNNVYSFSTDDLFHIPAAREHWERKMAILEEANLRRNLLCSKEGVSWSLSTALKIICLPWRLLVKWKLLLQGVSLSTEVDSKSQAAANLLVTNALTRAIQHREFVRSHPEVRHYGMLLQLAQDDVDILETALTSLQES